MPNAEIRMTKEYRISKPEARGILVGDSSQLWGVGSSGAKSGGRVAVDEPEDGREGSSVGPAQGEHNSAMALAGHHNQLAGNLLLSQCLVEELGLALQRGGIAFGIENDEGRSAGPRAGDW